MSWQAADSRELQRCDMDDITGHLPHMCEVEGTPAAVRNLLWKYMRYKQSIEHFQNTYLPITAGCQDARL